jgi:large conductance mechanosensitive channel
LGGVDFTNLFVVLSGPNVATLEEAKATAGAVTLNYGMFIQTVVDFLIVAFAIFMMVKWMNSLTKKEEAKPAPPPEPTKEEKLLTEIRDLLAKR